ncbi:MAG: ABC transporter ATP-binding protein [Deltaproteobacteria bacterium]|nr:ABC transporter ATP-binding protein [Deltaproteobacteria bacterium]
MHALRGIDMRVEPGEFCVLLGSSGSGKTTLLRCVAGLEKPDSGEIRLGDRIVFSDNPKTFVSAEDRGFGMVFQSYAIWPHMTVFENVALPLLHGKRKLLRQEVRGRVAHALRLVQLEGLQDRPAPQLSGGQQQRVALARALAVNAQALLMDEPLSNLDARLRESVRYEIRELAKKLNSTVLYVTHDQVEAMALADRILLIGEGRLLQSGRPHELYEKPIDPAVAEFLGTMNWLSGKIRERGFVQTELGLLRVHGAEKVGSELLLGIRPEDIRLKPVPSGEINEFRGEIVDNTYLGDHRLCKLKTPGKTMVAKLVGTDMGYGTVHFQVPEERIVVFHPNHKGKEESK